MTNELREHLAKVQHDIWSHWMQYMFTQGEYKKSSENSEGRTTRAWIMPPGKVVHWQRQMKTEYFDLTDKERESDRHQADKIIPIINEQIAAKIRDWNVSDGDPYLNDWALSELIATVCETAV